MLVTLCVAVCDVSNNAPELIVVKTHLFPGTVGALSRLAVVAGAVEGDVLVALALLVVHLVALLYLDLVHLYGTAGLARHHNLGAHHLT